MILTFGLITGVVVGSAVTIIVLEVINLVIRRAAKATGTSPTVIRDIGASLRIIVVLIIIALVLSLTGLASEFTSLAISGIGALAVSLALQNTLSNIISGMLMFLDGGICLNDTVEYGIVKGKIVRLVLRNTWIKMDSGQIAVISNSVLAGGPLINHSATQRLSKNTQSSRERNCWADPTDFKD